MTPSLTRFKRGLCECIAKMSSCSFVRNLNPINNKMEWKVVRDDYDYNQEIALSCYGDMLHDEERNKKFGKALKIAIDKFHAAGKKAHVLDIGTGTGLLSMLAVRYGADSVTACEAFLPMANCALRVLEDNNMADKVKVAKCHSTSLTVGENGHLKERANILVSEVFDTELIGEGAIKTFNHAFENLLTDDCVVIPSSGTVYAQVAESTLAQNWNKLQDWKSNGETLLKIPKEVKSCPGTGAVHDIQLSEFDPRHFKPLSEVVPIFRFDWGKKKLATDRRTESALKAVADGKAQVVFMWWHLDMDEVGDVVVSCAPVWEHPDAKGKNLDLKTLTKSLPWRDHWMQAVYFLNSELTLSRGEPFTLLSHHDEYSFWFDVDESHGRLLRDSRPVCTCTFHFLLSRQRVGAINDPARRSLYLTALERAVTPDTVCVVLGDVSLLGHVSARLGAKRVYLVSDSRIVDGVCQMLSTENGMPDVVKAVASPEAVAQALLTDHPTDSSDILILSEPYFRNSILPWDNLAFWYAKEDLCSALKSVDTVRSVRTLPGRCRLVGAAVEFDNLWKIATPLRSCEGFSMRVFDDLIEDAKEKSESYAEAQPLWEYPGVALSGPVTLLDFDLDATVPESTVRRTGHISVEAPGRCDGIALWTEYDFGDGLGLSVGPVGGKLVPGRYVEWDMFERQGVRLFRRQETVSPGDEFAYEATFDPNEAEVSLSFRFGKKS